MIAVFLGAEEKIVKLDFSFLNLKACKLESTEFKSFIKEITFEDSLEDAFAFYDGLLRDGRNNLRFWMYAFIPVDIKEDVYSKTFELLHSVMIVMFPSDFKLYGTVMYDKTDSGKYEHLYSRLYNREISHTWINNSLPKDMLLKFDEEKIDTINNFIKVAFTRLEPPDTWLDIAIRSYLNGYSQWSAEMAYLNYCMALEALTNSQTEITHRICRLCAVMNSNSKDEGKIIYYNMSQLYSLRSAIVHGEPHHSLADYFFSLRALVSSTLIEIISANINGRDQLNDIVNQHGYGDKPNFKTSEIAIDFNTNSKEFLTKLKPYKKTKNQSS